MNRGNDKVDIEELRQELNRLRIAALLVLIRKWNGVQNFKQRC